MIEAENITKFYGDTKAVSDVSFSVASGEVVGLLGPNGAGKTTTIRMLTTFLAPSLGTARVAGFDVCKQAQEVRKNIGYLPETPPLYPELRVIEYLNFVANIKGVQRAVLKSSVSRVLEQCDLTEVTKKLCSQLSKGFRQRLGLAAALVHSPKVLILDEPTSGLDPAQILEIRSLIGSLSKEHTVILSTHILPEVEETCSKVIIIASGQVVVQGALTELTKEKTLEQSFLQAVAGSNKNKEKETPVSINRN